MTTNTQSNKLKRYDNIEFVFRNKTVTGTVLHSSKSTTLIWLHEPAQKEGQLRYVTGKTQTMKYVKVPTTHIAGEYQELLKEICSVQKGDVVEYYDGRDGLVKGELCSLTARGYQLRVLNGSVSVPYNYKVTKSTSATSEPTALDIWDAVTVASGIDYHDGGQCQAFKVFHNDKAVMLLTEDAWAGDYHIAVIEQIDGKDPLEAFQADSIAAFKQLSIPENLHFYARAPECIAQWLTHRKLINLTDHFTHM